MDRFAVITHPLDKSELTETFTVAKLIPDMLISKMLRILPPFKMSEITGVASKYNRASGCEVFCPVTYDILNKDLGQPWLLKKIIAAGRVAEKQEAKIVGLNSCLPYIGNLTEILAHNIRIPVTSGNGYRIFAVIEAVKMALKGQEKQLESCSVLIIGATGQFGSVIATALAREVNGMSLVDNNEKTLEHLADRILYYTGLVVRTYSEVSNAALKNADVIINVCIDLKDDLLKEETFKTGAIIYDLSVPGILAKKAQKRADIILISKILTKVPYELKLEKKSFSSEKDIDPCMSEAMLLALEKRYALTGSGLNLSKVDEISDMARKHGFKVSGFLTKSNSDGIKNGLSGKIVVSGNV